MSFTLRFFNILLKIFSRRGMSDIHLTDDTAQRLVEHANKMDNIAARFIKNNVHPVITTEREHRVWVGVHGEFVISAWNQSIRRRPKKYQQTACAWVPTS